MTWNDTWPNWSDAGRRVEVERDDGTLIVGELVVEDAIPDGDGGEYPVFAIEVAPGTAPVGFALHKHWRFTA